MDVDARSSSRRRTAAAAVVVFLLCAGLVAWRMNRDAGPRGGSVAETAASSGASTLEPPAPALAGRAAPIRPAAAEPLPPSGSVSSADEDASDAPLAPADGPVRLVVRLVGEGPRPKRIEILATPNGDDEARCRLVMKDGILEGRLPAAKAYELYLWIDGWSTDASFSEARVVDSQLEIAVMLPQTPSLLVVDAATGAPLPSALGLTADSWMNEAMPAPSPASLLGARIVASGAGRLVLEKTALARTLWIGAEGHRWTQVHVLPDDHDRRVALANGGDLRVEVTGVTDWASFGLVASSIPSATSATGAVAPAGEEPPEVFLRATEVPGRYLLDGIAPGRWRLRFGWQTTYVIQELLGSVEADVRPGETTEVELRAGAAAPPWHDVTLEIVVPGAWTEAPRITVRGAGRKTLGAGHLDQVVFAEGPKGTWVGRLAGVPAGPYQVTVDPFGFFRFIHVREDTTVERVLVPPPAVVRVRVLDDQTGNPVEAAAVLAESPGPYGESQGAFAEAWADPVRRDDAVTSWGGTDAAKGEFEVATGAYVLRVPLGPIDVSVKAAAYVDATAQVTATASPDAAAEEVRLIRAGSILVRAVRKGSLDPTVDGYFSLDAVSVEGSEPGETGICSGDFRGGSSRLESLRPGTYRVRVRPTGSEAVIAREVKVLAGEEKTVDIELPAK